MTRQLFLVLLFWGQALLAQKVVGGPFVTMQVSRTATIAWIVEDSTATVRPAAGGPARESPVLRVEKTTLSGLLPGTKYEYTVAGGALKGSFVTPPPANGADPFR